MFTRAAAGAANTRGASGVGRGLRLGRGRSRVRGLVQTMGELPAVCLAEEIDTPGDGQIRAMVTLAGNPVVSTPNADRLDRALASARLHGGRRHLRERDHPPRRRDPARRRRRSSKGHYDLALLQLAIRNVANYSPPVLPLDDDQLDEWEILARLALIVQGAGAAADPAIVDDLADRRRWCATRCSTSTRRLPDGIPTSCSTSSPGVGGPSASSTSCCAPGPTATASGRYRPEPERPPG